MSIAGSAKRLLDGVSGLLSEVAYPKEKRIKREAVLKKMGDVIPPDEAKQFVENHVKESDEMYKHLVPDKQKSYLDKKVKSETEDTKKYLNAEYGKELDDSASFAEKALTPFQRRAYDRYTTIKKTREKVFGKGKE